MCSKEVSFCNIRQPYLVSRVRLKVCKSLKPNPLLNFEMHIFFQPTQWILFVLSFYPHQKFAIRLSNSWHKEIGSLKQLIIKVEIASAIAFNRIFLPSWHNNFPFRACRRCYTLVLMSKKAHLQDLPFIGERPKYLAHCAWSLPPQRAIISQLLYLLSHFSWIP